MATLVICRVIDNFGDAGFSLRLSLALAKQGQRIHLMCDRIETLAPMLPARLPPNLLIVSITSTDALHDFLSANSGEIHAVLECFGSSTVPMSPIDNSAIRNAIGQQTWLVIDYLSAEAWTENLHGLQSIDPTSGYFSRYFYPGFSPKTGGLIHSDLELSQTNKKPPQELNRIFVFSYPNAPIITLVNSLTGSQEIFLSGSTHPDQQLARTPFKPLNEFDQLLAEHDFLFVRGEDSFVRAQLSGRPLVWQIYPTEDMAHADKLDSFFRLYTREFEQDLKEALWSVWLIWNGLLEPSYFKANWVTLSANYTRLIDHTQRWQSRLVNGKNLVREVLTLMGG